MALGCFEGAVKEAGIVGFILPRTSQWSLSRPGTGEVYRPSRLEKASCVLSPSDFFVFFKKYFLQICFLFSFQVFTLSLLLLFLLFLRRDKTWKKVGYGCTCPISLRGYGRMVLNSRQAGFYSKVFPQKTDQNKVPRRLGGRNGGGIHCGWNGN